MIRTDYANPLVLPVKYGIVVLHEHHSNLPVQLPWILPIDLKALELRTEIEPIGPKFWMLHVWFFLDGDRFKCYIF